MTLTGRIRELYSQMVEHRPYSRFTKDKKQILANCQWAKRAEEWGAIHVDAWGKFNGLYQ